MEINEEKRQKFMEMAGKRVNNILHDIEILIPMSRSTNYDYTKDDVEQMFTAIINRLEDTKSEFEKKFEEKEINAKKIFTFSTTSKDEIEEIIE